VRLGHDGPRFFSPHADADCAQRSDLDSAPARNRHGVGNEHPECDHGRHSRCQPYFYIGAADAVGHAAPAHAVSDHSSAHRDRDPHGHRHLHIDRDALADCHEHVDSDTHRHRDRYRIHHALADDHCVGDADADAADPDADRDATGRVVNGDTVTIADADREPECITYTDGHRRRDCHPAVDCHIIVDRRRHRDRNCDRDGRPDITDAHSFGAERNGDAVADPDADCECDRVSQRDGNPDRDRRRANCDTDVHGHAEPDIHFDQRRRRLWQRHPRSRRNVHELSRRLHCAYLHRHHADPDLPHRLPGTLGLGTVGASGVGRVPQ
jgi:hypothetical protein